MPPAHKRFLATFEISFPFGAKLPDLYVLCPDPVVRYPPWCSGHTLSKPRARFVPSFPQPPSVSKERSMTCFHAKLWCAKMQYTARKGVVYKLCAG